ncbi:MAG TPA: DNA replication/repair protein RecF [Dehalococcoidia bacterium]|nr:DNA replication/repair protein RecF [Dehalococcoidia bacterium]
MHLRRLTLASFRNYSRLELDLGPGLVLLLGPNAQGKTNLLEAVCLLATARSDRAETDADFIAWSVRADPQPVARVVGAAARARADVTVEVIVAGRPGAHGNLVASKRLKLNGVPRRASDVVGAITAVLFTTDDMDLVRGAPSGRRRYLDVMLSQADHGYLRALQRYTRVVAQRNALLKRLQDRNARTDELSYWDEELARDGATLLTARAAAVADLARHARAAHARLGGESEHFAVAYAPRFSDAWHPERLASASAADVAPALLDRLQATHARDIAAGVTLTGPHRDDLAMTLGGEPAAAFASRGQQRTAALALRLAEAALLYARSGERPILLLDDVLSELDADRRASVLATLDADQVWITSPDPDRFDAALLSRAQVWRIDAGTAERA